MNLVILLLVLFWGQPTADAPAQRRAPNDPSCMIQMVDHARVWLVCSSSVWFSDNAGRAWQSIPLPGILNDGIPVRGKLNDAQKGWLSVNENVFSYDCEVKQWRHRARLPVGDGQVYALNVSPSGIGIAAITEGPDRRYSWIASWDGGGSWKNSDTVRIRIPVWTEHDKLFLLSDNAVTEATKDGRVLDRHHVKPEREWRASPQAFASRGNAAWIISDDGVISSTADEGVTWRDSSSIKWGRNVLNAISFEAIDESQLMLLGVDQVLRYSLDAGQTWVSSDRGRLRSISCRSLQDCLAINTVGDVVQISVR